VDYVSCEVMVGRIPIFFFF